VHVEADEGELTIRGTIVERERRGVLRRRTRRVGEFEYMVALPGLSGDVEPEARLHHGVLEVRVPKPEQSKPRQVQIREGDSGQASGGGTASGS
jgi:HSP20 family protein